MKSKGSIGWQKKQDDWRRFQKRRLRHENQNFSKKQQKSWEINLMVMRKPCVLQCLVFIGLMLCLVGYNQSGWSNMIWDFLLLFCCCRKSTVWWVFIGSLLKPDLFRDQKYESAADVSKNTVRNMRSYSYWKLWRSYRSYQLRLRIIFKNHSKLYTICLV